MTWYCNYDSGTSKRRNMYVLGISSFRSAKDHQKWDLVLCTHWNVAGSQHWEAILKRVYSLKRKSKLLKSKQKETKTREEGVILAHTFFLHEINNRQTLLPSWNHWSHPIKTCVGGHTSLCRIKIVERSELDLYLLQLNFWFTYSFTV